MCNTNEICDTYPESSWYKLLKNARKSWNNHKSYITILDKNTQKLILWCVEFDARKCTSNKKENVFEMARSFFDTKKTKEDVA